LIHFPGGVVDKGRLWVTAWNVSYFVGVKGTERNTFREPIIIELWAICSAGFYRTTERSGGHGSAACSLSQTTVLILQRIAQFVFLLLQIRCTYFIVTKLRIISDEGETDAEFYIFG